MCTGMLPRVHGVPLDGGFGRAKRRPREDRETQIDGAGIQSIDRVVEIDSEGFRSVEATGDCDQGLSEVCVDTPVATFVGIGQSTARNPALVSLC